MLTDAFEALAILLVAAAACLIALALIGGVLGFGIGLLFAAGPLLAGSWIATHGFPRRPKR